MLSSPPGATRSSSTSPTAPPVRDRPGTRPSGTSAREDCIVIVRLSRFAAGLRNLHNLLHQLDDAHVGLRSLVEPIDTTAPDGDLVIRAVDATLQLRAAWIAEVTTEGQTAARARGQRLGSPPKLTPEQGDLARQMHAAGHPAPSIAAMLKVATSTIYRHVRKPPDAVEDEAD
ncbi:recombinase family protein [Streptomyces europaeiscabiei]|uniref:recombinase family protein n=1 Tax=Streptomyces europaeiscabiei TaxID=146819 RepID=UPI002E26C2AE|nr:recombinase family protein [Streptomyces europaeiscabiei]